MKFSDLIKAREAALAADEAARAALHAEQETILTGVTEDKRSELNETEQTRFEEIRSEKRTLDEKIVERKGTLTELRADEAADEQATRDAQEKTDGAKRAPYDKVARVGQEERTYTSKTAAEGRSFFTDAYRAQKGNLDARSRIERHGQEVLVERELSERALATGGVAGLTVPQYLVAMAAPALRAGRPLANLVNRHELPDQGMSLIIPRGTTGASAAVQATENSAVSNTDEVWANLTVPVVTIAGQQDVSRQALERGEAIDAIIYLDLARAHAAQVDNQVINGSGGSGQALGILATAGIGAATAFGAVPGAANFNLKVAGAITNVTSAGAGVVPRLIIMHPRRWGWMLGLVDSTNRPIVTANSAQNALLELANPGKMGGDDDPINGATLSGVHNSGLPVLTDLNIPTNVGTNVEDIVLVIDTLENHLWEDGDGLPRQLEFEQTTGGSLTTKLVVYSYIAFTAGRYPAASAKVGGLDSTATFGLVAPSF